MSPSPTASHSTERIMKTRFLIISDTHSASSTSPLPKADVLIHCGDLTMIGHLEEYRATLKWLGECDAELKLVIAGNHDITLDEKYYERRGQFMHDLKEPDETIVAEAKELWTGEVASKAGVTYLEEGTYEFTLKSGAKLRLYASPYQPEFCDWAFPYFRHQDRFNPPHHVKPGCTSIAQNPILDFPAIDVLVTHGPPMGRLDETYEGTPVGCEHLLRAAYRARPKLHCFGHIHEARGAERVKWREHGHGQGLRDDWREHVESVERAAVDAGSIGMVDVSSRLDGDARPLEWGKETLMVNASVMDLNYKPVQGPWVVDLDLEKA